MAMSGASGPRTAPRLKVVKAARTTPGSSWPLGGPPPVLKPKAGEWPPCRVGTGWPARSAAHTRPTRASATRRARRRRGRSGRSTNRSSWTRVVERQEAVGDGGDGYAQGRRQQQGRQVRSRTNDRRGVHGCRVTLGGHRLTPCCSCSGVVSSPTSRREAQAPGWGRARRPRTWCASRSRTVALRPHPQRVTPRAPVAPRVRQSFSPRA